MADAILTPGGIYQIRNTTNGKRYIGSAIKLRTRLNQHRSDLNTGKHFNVKLTRAWEKYGADMFSFEVIERVEIKTDLIVREQYWIDHYKAATDGYNIKPTAGSSLGHKPSPESIEKRAAKLRGKKRPKEVGAKISAAKMGIKTGPEVGAKVAKALRGYKHTTEARANMSAAHKGLKQSPDAIEKTRAANLGRKHSEETRAKISAVQIGRKQSPEAIANRMAAMLPIFASPEYKAKISAASTGRIVSSETRDKLRYKKSPEHRRKLGDSIRAAWARKAQEKLEC